MRIADIAKLPTSVCLTDHNPATCNDVHGYAPRVHRVHESVLRAYQVLGWFR